MQIDEETEVGLNDNVLFIPDNAEQYDDAMEDGESNNTQGGVDKMNPASSGVPVDLSLLQTHRVRCCVCGVMTVPNASNTCINCLKQKIDITEGIPKNLTLQHCRECNRYMRPPWTTCELESAELLALCLKNIRGLKRVKLLDAVFVWTEPHSKRLKVKLTVQKEVQNNTMLQQTFVVEFTITNLQCDECKAEWTPHTWVARVQVRQRVHHKRTFLYLEQMILKHNAAEKATGIKECADGIDFHFKSKSHGNRMVDFIDGNFVSKAEKSSQLVTHDPRNNSHHYKHTTILFLAPICRDDLVLLPSGLAKKIGGIGPIVLVYKVTTSVHIVDIHTMRTHEIDETKYWRFCFTACAGRERLTEFIVIHMEDLDQADFSVSRATIKQKMKMVQVEVCRKDDFGKVACPTYILQTHLGEHLNYFDTVLGYDLELMQLGAIDDYNNEHVKAKNHMPDIVLVRKSYPKVKRRQNKRIWKLDRLAMEEIDENNRHEGDKAPKKKVYGGDRHQRQRELDEVIFKDDIEADPEFRANFNLRPDHDVIAELEAQMSSMKIDEKKSPIQDALDMGTVQVGGETRDIVKVERKTDYGQQLKEQKKASRAKNKEMFKLTLGGQRGSDEGSDWEDYEEDFPAVKLEELVKDLDKMKLDDSDEEQTTKEETKKEEIV